MALAYNQHQTVLEKVDCLLADFQSKHQIADQSYLKMIKNADVFHREANITMAREGDRLPSYQMVLEGTVRFQKRSPNGRQMTIFRVRGGESCALATACLLSDQPIPAEAVSESELYGCSIPKPVFLAGLEGSQKFRDFVFNGYSEQLGGVLNLATEIAFDSISVRLIKYLLSNSDRRGIVRRGHQEIAEDLGTVREVVSREIKGLKEKSWISVGRGRIKLLARGEMNEMLLKMSF